MARRNFGTVRRLPSGRWQARYSTDDGERITAPSTFPTKADANHWLASVETDIVRGTWQDPTLGRITIAEWSERWMATKLPTVRRATADQYEYILRMHIVPHLGDREIGSITPSEVQAWLALLHRDSGLAPNTVAKVYRLLKNLLGGAVDLEMIPRNPCRLKGASTERPPEIEVATPEQVVGAGRRRRRPVPSARLRRRLRRVALGRARRPPAPPYRPRARSRGRRAEAQRGQRRTRD